jgi:hypothetical protein
MASKPKDKLFPELRWLKVENSTTPLMGMMGTSGLSHRRGISRLSTQRSGLRYTSSAEHENITLSRCFALEK